MIGYRNGTRYKNASMFVYMIYLEFRRLSGRAGRDLLTAQGCQEHETHRNQQVACEWKNLKKILKAPGQTSSKKGATKRKGADAFQHPPLILPRYKEKLESTLADNWRNQSKILSCSKIRTNLGPFGFKPCEMSMLNPSLNRWLEMSRPCILWESGTRKYGLCSPWASLDEAGFPRSVSG